MNGSLPFRRVSVLGLGRTGRALVEALVPRGVKVFLSESRALTPEERAFLAAHKVAYEEQGHTKRILEADLIVPSPGVPSHAPMLQQAVASGVPVWSEIELAFQLARPQVVFAVTGTNGKSTTTELVGAILRARGARPVVAGNIGVPAIATVDEVQNRPWVLEVSSYQLEWTQTFRPHVAIWLNFAPDHLDHHGTLGAYFAAKARLLARQEAEDFAVLSGPLLAQVAPKAQGINFEETRLPKGWGQGIPHHLVEDLRAAWAGAVAAFPELVRIPPPYDKVRPSLDQPHRMEYVGSWRGIPFIDDSKGTNAHATLAALRAVPGPVVLILGGRHKGAGYEELVQAMPGKVRLCVLIGESRPFFARLLDAQGIPHRSARSPMEALQLAYTHAKRGDTVLLSPACASFDQFRDYAHRGQAFRRAFARLARV